MEKFSVAIQVLPQTNSKEETVRIVDEVIVYIASFDVNYVVTPFETVIEGDFETLMKIVQGFQDVAIRAGAPSVMSYLKMNYSPKEGVLTIDEKTGKYNR